MGALAPGIPVDYVAIGDSFTEGVGDWYPDGTPRGWADRFADRLAEYSGQLRYANLAVRGRLLRQVMEEQLPRALELAPTLVTFSAGGNDLLRPSGDPDRLARALEIGVRQLRASGAEVVLFTGVNIATGYMRGLIGRFARYYLNIRAIADRYGCFLVDQWSMPVFRDPRAWDTDRLHLSAEGHRRLALRVCEVVGVPVDEDWNAPWPPAAPVSRAQAWREDARWVRQYLVPWIHRRLTGRSSGDTVTAKRPVLEKYPPQD